MLRTRFVVALLLVGFCPLARSEPPPATVPAELLPVPKALEQGKFERPLREKYKAQLASRDAAERAALAHALHDQAAAASSPAERFVLLRMARDLAASGGDLPFALSIIDDMNGVFVIAAEEMKASTLAMAVDASRAPPEDLARSYLIVADQALRQWKLDLAGKAAYLAAKMAHGNPDLLAQARDREQSVRVRKTELHKVLDAQQKLAQHPEDAQANLLVGQFLCFGLNRWDEGLVMLAKSPAGKLKDLASADLASPGTPTAMAALADRWWDFVQGGACVGRGRAAYWYAKALPDLDGNRKDLAEKRIAEASTPR